MADLQVHARLDHARPRLPLYKLLNADFGIGHDVTLRVFNGDGRMEGDLKAHRIISIQLLEYQMGWAGG